MYKIEDCVLVDGEYFCWDTEESEIVPVEIKKLPKTVASVEKEKRRLH